MKPTTPLVAIPFLIGSAASQRPPVESWIDVAQRLGGSGSSVDSSYTRLIPSHAWADDATAPIWLEMEERGHDDLMRAAIPVLRKDAPTAVQELRRTLGAKAEIAVRHSFGDRSSKAKVRVIVSGPRDALAARIRSAIEHIEPDAVARLDALGVVEHDSFECEDGFVIRTVDGERIDVGSLPDSVAREGTHVRIVARRKASRPGRFLYYGVAGDWRTVATLVSIEPLPHEPAARGAAPSAAAEWRDLSRRDARALLDSGAHEQARVARPLASGFIVITDPGFAVCPRCQRALDKDWLFADAGRDRVDATLHLCARDRLYFLVRDGHDHGPFFPPSNRSEERR